MGTAVQEMVITLVLDTEEETPDTGSGLTGEEEIHIRIMTLFLSLETTPTIDHDGGGVCSLQVGCLASVRSLLILLKGLELESGGAIGVHHIHTL